MQTWTNSGSGRRRHGGSISVVFASEQERANGWNSKFASDQPAYSISPYFSIALIILPSEPSMLAVPPPPDFRPPERRDTLERNPQLLDE